MPRSYDAVLFDFGGVFTESHFPAFEEASLEMGAPAETVLEIVFGPYDQDTDHPWHRLERGEVSVPDARDEIMALGADHDLAIDPLAILARMSLGGGAREPLVARTRALRAEGYRTGLVTNNVREFRAHWHAVLPLSELFDVVIDSSEVGMRKPDPAIFEHALAEMGGVPAGRSVFLDDIQSNVAAATRLGMAGIVVTADSQAAIAELDRLLG